MVEERRKPNLSAKYSLEMGFSFHTHLGENLSIWKKAVLNQDIDCAVIIDGKEGAGKSVFALQIAVFLDKDHHLDPIKQICWTPESFMDAVGTLEKGKSIVWDESRRGLNRRRSGQDVNLKITDMLAECRQHNLFLVIVMPSFYDMDMNVAVWRTRILIHVNYHWDLTNEENPLVRGDFRFYNENGKLKLYTNPDLRKQYAYPYLPNDSFDGTFVRHYPVDEKLYKKLKRDSDIATNAAKKNPVESQEVAHARMLERGKVISLVSSVGKFRHGYREVLAQAYGVQAESVDNWMRLYRESELIKAGADYKLQRTSLKQEAAIRGNSIPGGDNTYLNEDEKKSVLPITFNQDDEQIESALLKGFSSLSAQKKEALLKTFKQNEVLEPNSAKTNDLGSKKEEKGDLV